MSARGVVTDWQGRMPAAVREILGEFDRAQASDEGTTEEGGIAARCVTAHGSYYRHVLVTAVTFACGGTGAQDAAAGPLAL